jgi:hypothetical protein
MEGDPLKSQLTSSDAQESSNEDKREPQFEDPQPSALRPQEMSKAAAAEIKPRIRNEALPMKDDDRFFDRWVVDKARALGRRAVRQPALEKLIKTVHAFAEWRSLRHGPAAERESFSDRELVASTNERIKNAEAEAEQLNAGAEDVEQAASLQLREVEETEEGISRLRPALRGSAWDFPLVMLANLVVFGIDFFIIQVALETIPGTAEQHRLTAIGLGAGAVLVGDVLGWIAAIGSIRRDGVLHRPAPAVTALVSGLLLLAVWFFGELGEFREFGLASAQEANGADLGEPTFFTIAQILFLLAAAATCFAYVGRRAGRELHGELESARTKHAKLEGEARSLREKAKAARRRATEAPALRKAAEERIRMRVQIAKGKARHDLKQGEYLESLVVPEYMHERAGVESGIGTWEREDAGPRIARLGLTPAASVAIAAVATLAVGGLAYLVVSSLLISIVSAAIAATALALVLTGDGDQEPGRSLRYIARLVAAAQRGSQRATDIERLVPLDEDGTPHDANGSQNGNGRPHDKLKEIFEDEDG